MRLQSEYHSVLGSLLFERGQIDEALMHFQKALALQRTTVGFTTTSATCALTKAKSATRSTYTGKAST
jgi:Flp pilus assembly protein TadD